jgi:2-hydroxyglutarate dehydrogenase
MFTPRCRDGNVKFGPSLEWIDVPPGAETTPDFWAAHLAPDALQLDAMHAEVSRYLPGVALAGLQPDYAGLRPKLVAPPHGKFHDFVFRTDHPGAFARAPAGEERAAPMVSLLGIESPGLTSALAIAELVVDDMLARGERAPAGL